MLTPSPSLQKSIYTQPSESNDPGERHITKAVVEMKETATLKKTGKQWDNYYSSVQSFNRLLEASWMPTRAFLLTALLSTS